MDTKGSDGSRASTAGKADGSWWRWTHGKSGSISSSSSSSPVLAVGGGHAEPAASHVHSLSSSNIHASSSSSSPVRWLKRSPARGVAREESSSGASVWTASSGSPKFFASFAGSSRGSSVPASRKNRASGSTGRTVAGRKVPTEYAQGEIAWTTGVAAKRKAASRKDRRSGRGSTSGHAVGSRMIGRATRSYLPEFVEDGDAQMASSSVFEFSQDKAGRKPGGSHSTGVSSSSKAFGSVGKTDSAASSPSSSSAASTLSLSSASSMGSSPFAGAGRSDPVVDCARAVLQDCIRQRHMEYNNARKRAIEGWNEFEAKGSGWQHASVTKASDWSMMSSSSSSSSDEELSQLSSLDHSFACDDKYDRDMCESKMSNEEVLRQSMLRGCALSSSPELECFSPLIEEKGLPVEIRYQLPIAMGTANETDKQCTICQIRYGIGDHIVTLPCQHFFHACCVDKWLWNHTSCPLCRTEVSLETEADAMTGKHKFTECSEVDQDRLRRQLRSTSHGAGFRPVIPADEDLTELETGLTSMSIEGEQESEEGEEYLICPTPQRPRAS